MVAGLPKKVMVEKPTFIGFFYFMIPTFCWDFLMST
jgi:hypothetical protein